MYTKRQIHHLFKLSSSLKLSSCAVLALICSGCSILGGVQNHLAYHHEMKAKRHQEISDELAARADDAEREEEAARARCEQKEQAARRETVDALRSKLSFNLDQRFTMSDLEVDVDELKEQLAKREKDYEEIKKLWDELERQMEDARTESELEELEARLDALADLGQRKGCCVKQRCRICQNRCCTCDKVCRPLLPELPAQRPVSPVDIPMVIKVRWRVGMDNPDVEEARIQRLPSLPALPAKRPCAPCDRKPNTHSYRRTRTTPHIPVKQPSHRDADQPPVPPEDDVPPVVTSISANMLRKESNQEFDHNILR